MPTTYLVVPFQEKDRAKALGARWDADVRQWYVPSGVNLSVFRQWIPIAGPSEKESQRRDLIAPAPIEALAQPRGVTVSQLLGGVAQAVSNAYQEGVWTRAEVLNVSVKGGHVYLELTERDEQGRLLAKALGTIWSSTAQRILREFENVTGAQLAPGIKLLVLAKPVVKPQYGLSLDITGIDPSYTIGDLEAQKRQIREELLAEQLFDRNKKLPAPWDFSRVLVVSPENAAGLGDFVAEAARLHEHGVCEFNYVHSRFQGQGAAGEILKALKGALADSRGTRLDAVIIIRGGGAVNDLAWLNDYQLSRFICTCEIPVLTGIGHERDSTILDEVAHRSFDTPSKVAAAIESQIARRAREVKDAYDAIMVRSGRLAERVRVDVERLDSDIRTAVRETLTLAHRTTGSNMSQVQLGALAQVHEARSLARELLRDIKDGARQDVLRARHQTPSALNMVKELSAAAVRSTRAEVRALVRSVLNQVDVQLERGQQRLEATTSVALERASQHVRAARQGAESLAREIAGQGPEKTLLRRFAMIRAADGQTVMSAEAALQAGAVTVIFKDGNVAAHVHVATPTSSPGDKNGG
jgi:exodeoxyribonuclease VII large subunit